MVTMVMGLGGESASNRKGIMAEKKITRCGKRNRKEKEKGQETRARRRRDLNKNESRDTWLLLQ